MIRRVYSFVLVSSLLLVLSSTAQASFVIDNSSFNSNANFFGRDSTVSGAQATTSTYGQTFRVPAAPNQAFTVLNSWSFFLNDDFSNTNYQSPVTFDFYVMEWLGNSATGVNLLAAPLRRTTGNVVGYEEINFNTGNLLLDPSRTYIAFISTSGVIASPARANVGASSSSSYADGQFRFIDNNDNTGLWASDWEAFNPSFQDLAFTATFSDPTAIPEPTSLALVGIVSCVAAGRVAVRRRRRAGVPASVGRSQSG